MMRRVSRYPPDGARLVRIEEGPPMYRMLGYADKNNQHSDLCDPPPPGYMGPFSGQRLWPNQLFHFGTGPFTLPSHPLPFTTVFWDNGVTCGRDIACETRPYFRMAQSSYPETRPEAAIFPEMAVPGTGMNSKFTNSGYRDMKGVAPIQHFYSKGLQDFKIVA